MSTATMSAEDALALANEFRAAAQRVGEFLYTNWNDLDHTSRTELRSLDLSLLNQANYLVTRAVGIRIETSGDAALAGLKATTRKAAAALTKLKDIKQIIKITTALVGLVAAIPTGNASTILGAVQGVIGAVSPGQAS